MPELPEVEALAYHLRQHAVGHQVARVDPASLSALRVHLDAPGGPGFDLTEAGTQKRLAVYLVADPAEVPGIARLGPDGLEVTREQLAALLAGRTERIKSVLTDQTVLAGVGNAYSDEILHV